MQNEETKEELARVAPFRPCVAPPGSTAETSPGAVIDAKRPERRQLRILTCKRCGCAIDTGLCGYTCELDSTMPQDRAVEDMEIQIYEYVGSEPPPAPVAPGGAA